VNDKLLLLASPCDLWPLPSHPHLFGSSFMASKAKEQKIIINSGKAPIYHDFVEVF
jgi:hypothetical protein